MTKETPVIIFGPGYTCNRLARRLVARNIPVFTAARNPDKLASLAAAGIVVTALDDAKLPPNARLVYSIPPLSPTEELPLRNFIHTLQPHRVVYISSTAVYGNQTKVTEISPTDGSSERGCRRIEAEAWFGAGPWSSLILRPAAIYGPGRGVHVRVREGRVARGAGTAITSRIHVDDLVQLLEAGLDSDLAGCWPVADEVPCPTLEIATWCAEQMGVAFVMDPAKDFPEEGRQVDGSEIFRQLDVKILWPTWRSGISASMAEEKRAEES